MKQTEEVPVRYGFIVSAAVLMFLGVWMGATFFRTILRSRQVHHNTKKFEHASLSLRDNLATYQTTPVSMSGEPQQTQTVRRLAVYYGRRVYAGAPPRIPHPVKERNGKVEDCLNCHKTGGYVPKYGMYAPVTPHAHFINCSQCHVPTRSGTQFRGQNWVSVAPPKLRRTPLPGGPPPMPHGLQLRKNCLSCHAGPAAVKEIRTPHPERINCVQCHVPRRRVKPFRSAFKH